MPLFGSLLPRHLEIIFEINRRFLDELRRRFPGDDELARRLSIIDESGDRSVRMAHLASVGSHAINGVAALHTELLKRRSFATSTRPSRIALVNVTNGVTPRRWIALRQPRAERADQSTGSAIAGSRNLEEELDRGSSRSRPMPAFQAAWRTIKAANKRRLADVIRQRTGIEVDPQSLFDIQVKRLHENKRQHLNVLYLVTGTCRLKRGAAPRLRRGPLSSEGRRRQVTGWPS